MAENYRNFWMQISVPSPSPTHTVIEKDENAKPMKVEGEYKKVRKMFYVEYDHEVFEKYKFENRELIEEYLIAHGKKINITTFKEHKLNYVEQTGILTQFACDNCTEFGFVKAGLIANIKYVHDCGSESCWNYTQSMGDVCNCDDCAGCLLAKYANLSSYELLDELCCESGEEGPKLLCAEGRCLKRRCGEGRYRSLLMSGRGCHTYKRNVTREVEFKRIVKHEVDDRDYKFVITDSLPWKQYVHYFLNVLKKHIHHIFIKKKQNTERHKICREHDQILLPQTAVFSSIDFIANKTLSPKVVSQGTSTKLPQISILIIYECRNINDTIKQSAHVYISDQTEHGWYSAIPALKQYYQRIRSDMENCAIEFKTNIIFGDRGRKDIWCAPFMAYACELANHFNIIIQPNTTASGEGKWLHDQVGGTVAQFIQHAVKIGRIKFGPNDSPASKIVSHCNQHFKKSQTDTIDRCFYILETDAIKRHPSPVNSLEIGDSKAGISDYHCAVIKPGNKVMFRKQSCFCTETLASNFGNNCHEQYCGKWESTALSQYPKYADAVHTPKLKKKGNNEKIVNKRKRKQPEPVPQPLRQRSCSVSKPRKPRPIKRRKVIRVPTSAANASNPHLNVPPLESHNC